MPKEDETLAAILEEMRREAAHLICGPRIYAPSLRDVLQWADRIEAAAKREQQDAMKTAFLTKCKVCEKVGPAAPGNAAAMREALIKAKLYFDHRGEGTNLDDAGMAIDAITSIDAALAAPARNCDRPKDRAEDAFMAKFGRPWTTAEDELATWLFAPAEVDHG